MNGDAEMSTSRSATEAQMGDWRKLQNYEGDRGQRKVIMQREREADCASYSLTSDQKLAGASRIPPDRTAPAPHAGAPQFPGVCA